MKDPVYRLCFRTARQCIDSAKCAAIEAIMKKDTKPDYLELKKIPGKGEKIFDPNMICHYGLLVYLKDVTTLIQHSFIFFRFGTMGIFRIQNNCIYYIFFAGTGVIAKANIPSGAFVLYYSGTYLAADTEDFKDAYTFEVQQGRKKVW